MNRFKFSNYKLPHMAPFNNNKAESPKIKRQKTQEEKMAEAKETFRKISQKPLLEPKPLHPDSKGSSIKQTTSNNKIKIVGMEKAPELNQRTKDSLQAQAMKFNKPFFSPEYGVNVDPEDGVLSNRPIYSDGTKLTYDIEDRPIEDLVNQAYSKRRDEYMSMVGKKKHPMLPAQTKEQAEREFMNESYSTKFNPKTRQIERLVNSSGDGAISEEELSKVPSYLRNPFIQ